MNSCGNAKRFQNLTDFFQCVSLIAQQLSWDFEAL